MWVAALLHPLRVAADPFLRGDANASGAVDISDMSFVLNFLFLGGPGPGCGDAADINDDGGIDISDASYGLNFLFLGGPAPPAPGTAQPGVDGTPDDAFACGDPAEVSPAMELVDLKEDVGGFGADASGRIGIATIPGQGLAAVIDLATGRQVGEFRTGFQPGETRFAPRAPFALINNLGSLAQPETDATWVDLRAPDRPVARQVKVGARVFDLRWASDALALALGAGTAERPADLLALIDGANGEIAGSLRLGFRPRGVDVDARGGAAVVVGEGPDLEQGGGGESAGGVALVDLVRGQILRTARVPEAPLPIAARFIGSEVLVSDGSQTGPAVVKLNQDLKIVGAVGRGRRGELFLHPDGRRAYSLTQAANEVLIFDTASMREIATLHLDEPDSDPVDLPDRPSRRLAYIEQDNLLLVASGHGGHIAGIDTKSDRLLGQVHADSRNLGLPITELIVGGDGRSVLFSSGSLISSLAISDIRFERIRLIDWTRILVPIDRIAISGDTCSGDVAILMDDGNGSNATSFVSAGNQEIMSNVIPRFYQSFPDVYDFVVAFYGSEFPDITSPGAFAWSLTTRNFTRNLNRGLGNGINGSGTIITNAGTNRMQCMIWENDLNEYDAAMSCVNLGNDVFGNLRDGLAILGQEVLHRWSSRLDVAGKGCTILRDNAHYHAFFNSDASVVGGSQGFRIQDNGGNNFARTAVESIFSQYDQYLMGFLRPDQVTRAMFCVQNPVLNADNINFTGTRRNISMNDITTANGSRIPAAAISQHTFNIAFVLVVPNGDHALTADLNEVRAFRDEFARFFNEQTGGGGHLNTRICPTPFTRVLRTITLGKGCNDVKVSPNGRWAYVVHFGEDQVTVIDTDPASATFHQVLGTIDVGASPAAVDFHPNSSRAFVVIRDLDRVDVINTATRTVIDGIPVGNEPIDIHINPTPFGFVTNRLDDDVTVIRPNVPDAVGDVPSGGDRPQGVAGTIDGEVVAFTNRTSNRLVVHGVRSGIQRNVNTGNNPIAVDIVQYESLPNQTVARTNASTSAVALAYVANADSDSVTVVDITTDPDDPGSFTAAGIDTIDVGDNPVAVAFQPNGAIALVANREDATVSVIEVASHTVITTVGVGLAPEAIAFSPDGKRAYVANANGNTVTVLE